MPAVLVEVGFINTDVTMLYLTKNFLILHSKALRMESFKPSINTDTKTTEVNNNEEQNNYFPTPESNTSDMSDNYDK